MAAMHRDLVASTDIVLCERRFWPKPDPESPFVLPSEDPSISAELTALKTKKEKPNEPQSTNRSKQQPSNPLV